MSVPRADPVLDPARLAALYHLALLDHATDPAFDRLTQLAAKLLHAPIALVSLVDHDRQVFRSCVGLPEPWASRRETPLSHSFCQHTLRLGVPFLVTNAHTDPRVQDNLALTDLNVVAYAGIPLVTSSGYALGAFCVIDHTPRTWTADEVAMLTDLAATVITEIELRSEIAERQRVEAERAAMLAREQAARAAAEVAWQRLAVLADASQLLAVTLVDDATLARIAELALPALGDACAVHLMAEEGRLHCVALAAAGDRAGHLLRALIQARPGMPQWDDHHPLARVLRIGQVELFPDDSSASLSPLVAGGDPRARLLAQQPGALLVAPIEAHGRILGTLTCLAMVGGRRYGEADMTLAQDLGRRVGAAIDNARLYRDTVAAVQARDDILALVSHDLRAPVVVVQLYTQLLRQQLASHVERDAVVAAGLTQIETAAHKMHTLIGDLLDVAALRAGRPPRGERRWTDLVALVRQVMAEHQRLAPQHLLRVEAAVPQLVGFVDTDRLERALTNLVANAITYSPRGGEVVVGVAPVAEGEQPWAIVTVRDQGLGIPTHDLPYIFTPFFRASNVVNRISGAGLGLTSVQQIVARHGGSLAVDSREGEGTTFTLRLPLAQSAEEDV